jgi:hypothetical protein
MDIKSEKFSSILELIIVILLGITAVLTAYASWQSSLYDGNQASAYTESTAILSDANSLYNQDYQSIMQDMNTWNQIIDIRTDLLYATDKNDTVEMDRLQYKLDQIMYNNVDDHLQEAIDWADAQQDYASPFDKEGFSESYYTDADQMYADGWAKMDEGQEANDLGDKQGLVTVIFSVVLFLLGIVSTLKNVKIRMSVVGLSFATLVYGVIMMISVPMLTPGA